MGIADLALIIRGVPERIVVVVEGVVHGAVFALGLFVAHTDNLCIGVIENVVAGCDIVGQRIAEVEREHTMRRFPRVAQRSEVAAAHGVVTKARGVSHGITVVFLTVEVVVSDQAIGVACRGKRLARERLCAYRLYLLLSQLLLPHTQLIDAAVHRDGATHLQGTEQ